MGNRIATRIISTDGHDLWVSDCWMCGTVFAMPRFMMEARRKDGAAMFCPLGHLGYFRNDKSLDQLRIEELERRLVAEHSRAESALKQREWAESSAKGANIAAGIAKAAQKRLMKRVHAGVCPHCRRTFPQLAAHMKTKHQQ